MGWRVSPGGGVQRGDWCGTDCVWCCGRRSGWVVAMWRGRNRAEWHRGGVLSADWGTGKGLGVLAAFGRCRYERAKVGARKKNRGLGGESTVLATRFVS
jgi:hypothetical protein